MDPIKTFVEIGEKKIFAGAVDWPGWCRSARDEKTALQSLLAYGPRYAQVLRSREIEFQLPTIAEDLWVIERHEGNATTDFGAPGIVLDADREPLDRRDLERLHSILLACWQAFDDSIQRAGGRELQKGPRGGGRDLGTIVNHVAEAEKAYLSKLGWKDKKGAAEVPVQRRQVILDALEAAVRGELPEQGPRGGTIWPGRYFIRRTAWHVLDHAWEIDDRIL